MVFSSLLFLFGFIPVFFLLYFLSPKKLKNYTALIGSYAFYSWGAPKIVFFLFLGSLIDYLLGKRIARHAPQSRESKRVLAVGVLINLFFLAYFKYSNFFVEELNQLFSSLGFGVIPWTEVLLPIGISFFTFQKMSYLVDVYRRLVPPASSFFSYALYVALFPQLIAGPIVRYHDVAKQLESRNVTAEEVFYGIFRFCVGLAKEVLIANPLGQVADTVFALHDASITLPYAWVALLCYSFQIYFDFSGYSDMAIGLGRMMGFRFLENFNWPYISETFSEFWRRWHISLSNWMREYLYIPLGGNRVSPFRMYLNLWIVFLLSGLWHGASWTFVAWGAFHGTFLALDKLTWLKLSSKMPRFFNVALTFFLVNLGWVLFRSESFDFALMFFGRMFEFSTLSTRHSDLLWPDIIGNRAVVILILAAFISFSPLFPSFEWIKRRIPELHSGRGILLRFSAALFCFLFSTIALANSQFNPFIYFRF